jgi:hypothetical protein
MLHDALSNVQGKHYLIAGLYRYELYHFICIFNENQFRLLLFFAFERALPMSCE